MNKRDYYRQYMSIPKNREKARERYKRYYEINREKINARKRITGKAWRERNKEHLKQLQKKSREKNKEKIKIRKKEYALKNKEKIAIKRKEYYLKNKEKILIQSKERRKNPEQIIKMRNYSRQRARMKRKTDIVFKITANIRRRINLGLNGIYKSRPALKLIGLDSWDDLWNYLGSKFKPGMTKDNYGLKGWHVDHIIPCKAFDLTNEEEQKKCFHYTNLQPLWAEDNLKKGAKYEI